MFIPKAFEQTDVVVMQQLIRENSFATLVTATESGIEANHLPFLLRDDGSEFGILVGHVARVNPVWKTFNADQSVLVIFQGTDAYISPSWYPTKKENGKAVPTWNYTVVHARGKMRVIEDGEWLSELLNELSNTHESQFDKPWAMSDAPSDYIEKLSSAIVGIEIPVISLIGKWKLSQNQPEQNRLGIVHALDSSDSDKQHTMAALIKNL